MATLKDLLADEAQVILQMQVLNESLARIHIRMAEIRNINRNAITYNLPIETLSAIFQAGIFETSYSPPVSRFDPKPQMPFELLVSSVSRRWRSVALRTPQLWTDLQLDVSRSAEDLLDLYLRRSKICLLDITFKNSRYRGLYPAEDIYTKNFKCYLGRLVPHVARWRAFVIEGLAIELLSKALPSLSGLSVPALERMRVSCVDREPTTMEVFSGGAPLLSSLELFGTYIRPPRSDVKSLELGYCTRTLTHKEFTQLMRPMRSLMHLSIYSSTASHSSHHSPITLISVLSLDLCLEHNDVGALRSLNLPALESLRVRGSTENLIVAFTRHHRSYPILRSLKILLKSTKASQALPAAITRDFITLLPSVQSVTLDGANPTPILHALKNLQPLWPELSVMTFIPLNHADASLKMTWDNIVQVVGNRRKLGYPVSQIRLSSQMLKRFTHRQQQRLRTMVVLEEC